MASVVQNMLERSLGDGARAAKFDCYVNLPSTLFQSKDDLLMLVKTSSFPGKNHTVIDFKYRGISLPLKGQTTYDNTWSCTFYLTQDHKLKKAFEDWIEALDQQNNIKEITSTVSSVQSYNSSNGYVTDMQIAQTDFHGDQQTAVYLMYNVFPKSVSSVEVDYSNAASVLEFTVEFSYSHFDTKIVKAKDGSFVDDIKNKVSDAISSVVGSTKQQLSTALSGIVSSFSGDSELGSDDTVYDPDDMGSKLE